MYKILNIKLFKTLGSYFIICLLLSFAFQKLVDINLIFTLTDLVVFTNFFECIVLCSRLILVLSIVLILYQDFVDLYGGKFIFINIRKANNFKYFMHIIFKEFVCLIFLSLTYLISQLMSNVIVGEINLKIFIIHYFNFIGLVFILFLLMCLVSTSIPQEYVIGFLLGVVLVYFIIFYNQGLLSGIGVYLNLNQSWLGIQLIMIAILIGVVYHRQQTWR